MWRPPAAVWGRRPPPPPPPPPVVPPPRTPPSAAASLRTTRCKAINASTFNSRSFVVGNDSLNGERLSELRIDLSTALLPDVVFDPFGQAGDAVAKSYTLDGGLKQASYVFEQPHDGGFDVLVVRYNGFDPGDFSAFSLDIDPTSIKGGSAPGPAESGSVGGLELVGATVTAPFDNGPTLTGQATRLPDDGRATPAPTAGGAAGPGAARGVVERGEGWCTEPAGCGV